MGGKRKKVPSEQAVERDAAADSGADEATRPPEVKFDFGPRGYGVLTARETPALLWGQEAPADAVSPVLIEREINYLKYLLHNCGEQRLEILQLRADTRQVLAALSAA